MCATYRKKGRENTTTRKCIHNMQKFIGRVVRFVYPFFCTTFCAARLVKSKCTLFLCALSFPFHYECFALAYSPHAFSRCFVLFFGVRYENGWNCSNNAAVIDVPVCRAMALFPIDEQRNEEEATAAAKKWKHRPTRRLPIVNLIKFCFVLLAGHCRMAVQPPCSAADRIGSCSIGWRPRRRNIKKYWWVEQNSVQVCVWLLRFVPDDKTAAAVARYDIDKFDWKLFSDFFLFSYGANARTLLHNDSTTSRKACNRDMKIAESCSWNVRDPYRTVLIRWRFQPLSQMSHLQQQQRSEQFVQWPKLSAWCRNYRPMSIDQNCTLLSRVRIETTVWEARLGIWKIWNYRWQ